MNKLRKIRISIRFIAGFLYLFFFFQQDRGRKIFLFFWWWKAEVLQRYLFYNSLNIFEPRLVKISIVCCRKWTNCGRSVLRYVLSPVFFIYFFFFNRIEKGWFFSTMKGWGFAKIFIFWIFPKLDWLNYKNIQFICRGKWANVKLRSRLFIYILFYRYWFPLSNYKNPINRRKERVSTKQLYFYLNFS